MYHKEWRQGGSLEGMSKSPRDPSRPLDQGGDHGGEVAKSRHRGHVSSDPGTHLITVVFTTVLI